MEHRCGERMHLDQPARLDLGSGLVETGRLRDASLTGGYVETDANLSLESYLHLELEWVYRNHAVRCRIPAFVVRQDDHGIGVEWCEFESRWIAWLISSRFPPIYATARADESSPGTLAVAGNALTRSP